MKKLKVVKGAKCMACLECVRACSQSFYKEFDPDKSCIQIIDKKGDAKPMVCVQCGKCAKALSGRRNYTECQGRIHDQQEELYRMWQMCRSLSIWRYGKSRRITGEQQVYCMWYLCKSLSGRCSGDRRRLIKTRKGLALLRHTLYA